jgi:hypothetical protein
MKTVRQFADDGAVVVEVDAMSDFGRGLMAISNPKVSGASPPPAQSPRSLGSRGRRRPRGPGGGRGRRGRREQLRVLDVRPGRRLGVDGPAPSPAVAPDPAVALRRNLVGQGQRHPRLLATRAARFPSRDQ